MIAVRYLSCVVLVGLATYEVPLAIAEVGPCQVIFGSPSRHWDFGMVQSRGDGLES